MVRGGMMSNNLLLTKLRKLLKSDLDLQAPCQNVNYKQVSGKGHRELLPCQHPKCCKVLFCYQKILAGIFNKGSNKQLEISVETFETNLGQSNVSLDGKNVYNSGQLVVLLGRTSTLKSLYVPVTCTRRFFGMWDLQFFFFFLC